MRKVVMIMGTARSGTSLACGVVDALGVRIVPNESKLHQLQHNPKGAFEFDNIMELKMEEFHELLLESAPTEGNWGFKCPTIDSRLNVLLQNLSDIHLICVFRNVVDHAKSFQMFRLKNDGVKTPLNDLIKEMTQHNLTVANWAVNSGHPVFYTTYEGLKYKPLEESKKIAKFLDVEMTEDLKANVLKFVEPDLHTWKDEGLETLPVEIDVSKYQ